MTDFYKESRIQGTRPRLVLHLGSLLAGTALYLGERAADESGLPALILLVATLVAGWLPPIRMSRRTETAVAGCLAAAAVAEGVLRADIRVLAAAHFLMAMQVVMLLKPSTPRDHRYLLVAALMQALVSATLSDSLVFMAVLTLYGLAAVMGLRFLRYPYPTELRRIGTRDWIGRAGLPMAGLGALLGTIVLLFPLLPRFPPGMVGGHLNPAFRRTGLARSISLGAPGRFFQDDSEAYRVRGKRPYYLRGMVLDRYSAGNWEATGRKIQSLEDANREGFLPIGLPQAGRSGESMDEVEVEFRGGMAREILVAPTQTVAVRIEGSGVARDERGTLLSTRDLDIGDRYTLRVDSGRSGAGRYEGIPHDRWRYMQVPRVIRPQLESIASRIAGDAVLASEKAERVVSHLKSRYRYNLARRMRRLRGDPVIHFLNQSRKGHCEHFASAAALLLRTLDVPTRVVTGFLPGEPGPGFRTVRQLHAHAWIEAEVSPGLWRTYDPTPPRSDLNPSGLGGWFRRAGRRLETRWRRSVVNFSMYEQRDLFLRWTRSLKAVLSDTARLFRQSVIPLLAAVALACALGLARWLGLRLPRWEKRRRGDLRATPRGMGTADYCRFLEILAARGHRRGLSVTPREFLRSLESSAFHPLDLATSITELYYRARFGGAAGGALRQLRDGVGQLERELESRSG